MLRLTISELSDAFWARHMIPQMETDRVGSYTSDCEEYTRDCIYRSGDGNDPGDDFTCATQGLSLEWTTRASHRVAFASRQV